MFGYVKIHGETLDKQDKQRYHESCCGLCRRLGMDYGGIGRAFKQSSGKGSGASAPA